jgi:hypothetical protein
MDTPIVILQAEKNIVEILSTRPQYRKTLEMAISNEEQNTDNQRYLGWTWFDVETHPAKLVRLVTEGIVRVNFRSNSSTHYMLKERQAAKTALGNAKVNF